MKLKIVNARKLCFKILGDLGFPEEEKTLITRNLIEAELAGRRSHGLSRLVSIRKFVNSENLGRRIAVGGEAIQILKQTPNSLFLDAKYKAGFYTIYKSLEQAIPMAKKGGIVSVGIKNAGYATGFIGAYAREATSNDLIFIGFHSIYGDLVPYGSTKAIFGTNPLTVGIPTFTEPVILDMASSLTTMGDVVIAKNEGKQLKDKVAVDGDGNITNDPLKVLTEGGLLPIAGHKGSGLAFVIQLLAGALTGSSVGYAIPGGWCSFYILINPVLFRSINDYKTDVEKAIAELKKAPRAKGFEEVLFPGERASRKRNEHMKLGEIEVSESLLQLLKS